MDRKVPIAIIGAIIIQTLSIGWFVSKLDSRIGTLEETDKRHEARLEQDRLALENGTNNLNSINLRLTRVEEQVTTTKEVVKEINAKIDRLLGRP